MTRLTADQRQDICPDSERALINAKDYLKKQRDYCLAECENCNELALLKKIYWELRKQNEL